MGNCVRVLPHVLPVDTHSKRHGSIAMLTTSKNAIARGNSLGPLICGVLLTNLCWSWHKWIAVIFTNLNFPAIMCFVPEMRYSRDHANFIAEVGVASHFSRKKIAVASASSVI